MNKKMVNCIFFNIESSEILISLQKHKKSRILELALFPLTLNGNLPPPDISLRQIYRGQKKKKKLSANH